MRITINSQTLAEELRPLAKVVPAKPALAILGSVMLTAVDGLKMYATDLEVGFATQCAAEVEEPGAVCIPAAKFLSLVEQFRDGEVEIATEGTQATMKCGSFKSKLQIMSTEDFPKFPQIEGETNAFNAEAFRLLIQKTRYAVATSTKYTLQGVLLSLVGPAAAMVATDSKRIAIATTARGHLVGGEDGPDAKILIPSKALDTLVSQSDVGMLELTVSKKHLAFKAGARTIVSRMIDGEFPKYERFVPRDNDKTITVDKNRLMAALKRILVVSEDNRATYFDAADNYLTLSSSSAEVGFADEGLTAEYEGPPIKVCMNGGYMLDFLEAANGPNITIDLKDKKSAALLKDGRDYVAVVMLMAGAK